MADKAETGIAWGAARALEQGFESPGGTLAIGGKTASALAEAQGTPLFVYSGNLIKARMAALKRLMPEDLHIHYAVKANPFPPLLELMAELADGLDLASGGELALAETLSKNPGHLSLTGPGKGSTEILAGIAAGLLFNAESETELARIEEHARTMGVRARAALRINPDFDLRAGGMRMGGGASFFGMDAEAAPGVMQRWTKKYPHLDFQGFHIFAGSQNLDAGALSDMHAATFDLAARLAARAPAPVRYLNIGGGYGIPYFEKEQKLDIESVASSLSRAMEVRADNLSGARIAIELGRYLVGEAGVYLVRVLDRKVSHGKTFLITGGGMHQHLAATGNLGQVVRRNFPVAVANKMDAPAEETVTVTGRLCTPLDVLARDVQLPWAGLGDLIAVFQSGAYAKSASPSGFLSHAEAGEILA